MVALMGQKLGMTQVYEGDEGAFVPVTVVRVSPNVVTALATQDKHGYNAVQLGFLEQKEKRVSRARAGQSKKSNVPLTKILREFRTSRAGEYKVGATFSAAAFAAGDKIDVQGVSKGRGFQGVMKRHNFKGGRDTHGCSLSHRSPGSVGQRTYPGRVIPGKKMPGHMGDETVTVKNLRIVGVEAEQNLVLVRGALPGGKNAVVCLCPQAKDFENRLLTAGTEKAAS